MTMGLLERVVDRAQAERVPLEVMLEVTHRCNLPCKHCYLPDHENHGELSFDEICRVLDELADAGTAFLTLTGGEVMSRSDFLDILDAAAERGFAIKVLSNATLISDEAADRFRDAGVVEVSVSVYGASPEVHDAVTDMPGSFERTMAGIERLRARGVHVQIKSPLMTPNADGARDLHAFARAHHLPCSFDATITPRNDGARGPLGLALAHDRMVELLSTPPLTELNQWSPDSPGPDFCAAGRSYCAIGPTGDVLPCIAMPQPQAAVGNVRRQVFGEIWRTAPLLERLRALTFQDLRACGTCDVKAACSRCPGVAMHYGQGLDGCDPIGKQVARAKTAARLRVIQ
jgi:radical SAM protein with 4Fe4S-binding SPASM domain